ncbi:hypothetical protein DFP72DRAFT_820078 [Ephemerocybe angulata]|uniref:MYND-type domain-containing protein n=1 Tax=Ephemerocybe angulata TaxID=980116 RepID=A0A8H6HMM9_9AGAR|nr:hypothetical protein DFP72DRAFT_820078 [Tulosesus angulatus]
MPRGQRTIFLPKSSEDLKKCGSSQCAKFSEKQLKLCSNCAEVAYCDSECQKADWRDHKRHCGKTDRVELEAFMPLIAVMMLTHRTHPSCPHSPALSHKIINSPNPGTPAITFPDGSSATLVLLGERTAPNALQSHEWWPTAESIDTRNQFVKRFFSETPLLPSVLAILLSILVEVYSTTHVPASDAHDGKAQRRVRLKYRGSPISDFGIAKGSVVNVSAENRFVYYTIDPAGGTGTFTKGMDPDDHYWIYFTTTTGEEITLDCGLLTFAYPFIVRAQPYDKFCDLPAATSAAPAFFRGKEYRHLPDMHREKARFSVLRDARMHEAVRLSREFYTEGEIGAVIGFMERVAGRPCSDIEKYLVHQWTMDSSKVLDQVVASRAYLDYPEEPDLGMMGIPVPSFLEGDAGKKAEEELTNYMKKWSRKYKKGKVSLDQFTDAFVTHAREKRQELGDGEGPGRR